MDSVTFLSIILRHVIWAFVILVALGNILEQRRRETKTGEFEDHE